MTQKLTDVERDAAKAMVRDVLYKLENYIIDLRLASQNEANNIGASREALIESAFNLAVASDA